MSFDTGYRAVLVIVLLGFGWQVWPSAMAAFNMFIAGFVFGCEIQTRVFKAVHPEVKVQS
jgi:hypothetical protein